MYTKEQFAKLIDNTFLKPSATGEEVARFCEESRRSHFAAVVVFPFWVPLAVRQLEGSDVKVCTPIGFPYGANTRASKVYEARNAVTNGADEIDVVINVGAVKSGDLDFLRRELADVVGAVGLSGMTQDAKRTLVKAIIETPLLTESEKAAVCEIAVECGVDFIKTSTGTAPNGATVDDIRLIRSIVGPAVGVKAAGGIRTLDHAMNLLDAGANRLGTSSGLLLAHTYNPSELLRAVK